MTEAVMQASLQLNFLNNEGLPNHPVLQKFTI